MAGKALQAQRTISETTQEITFTPRAEEHARRLIEVAPPGSSLWLVPEAGHIQSFEQEPQEYLNRLINYFSSF